MKIRKPYMKYNYLINEKKQLYFPSKEKIKVIVKQPKK